MTKTKSKKAGVPALDPEGLAFARFLTVIGAVLSAACFTAAFAGAIWG